MEKQEITREQLMAEIETLQMKIEKLKETEIKAEEDLQKENCRRRKSGAVSFCSFIIKPRN